ncbi:MAG: hypothetical protein H7126_14785, partial [Candidatus Parcubacteria bacterium]|nr:hypothetical protein [Leptolyngbyaceae cyanobacterium LF-bin-113]
MRLSPILMAAFAAVATVGWSNSANAQTPEVSQQSRTTQAMGNNPVAKPNQQQEKTIALTKRSGQDVVVETVKVSEVAAPDKIAAYPLLKPFQPKLATAAIQIAQTQGSPVDEQQPTPIQLNPPSPTAPTLTIPIVPSTVPPTPQVTPAPSSQPETPATPSTT